MATLTVYSSASDGHIEAYDGLLTGETNQECWDRVHDNPGDGSNYVNIVKDVTATTLKARADNITGSSARKFTIFRAFLYFDTSSIPDDAIIRSATLSLYITSIHQSDTLEEIRVQSGMPTYPTDPLADTDYNYTYYSGNYGSIVANTITVNQYNDIDLDTSLINKTGTTKLCVRDGDYDIDDQYPVPSDTYHGITFYSSEQGAGYQPKLTVVYGYDREIAGVLTAQAAVAGNSVGVFGLPAVLTGGGALAVAAQVIGVQLVSAILSAAGRIICAMSVETARQIVYSGTLSPGDVLVIDTDEMTVELNGVNVTKYFTGEFFKLFIGDNQIEYRDNEATRTALVHVAHKDRWI